MNIMALAAMALLAAANQGHAQSSYYDRQPDAPPAPAAPRDVDNVKVAWADVLRVDPVYDRVAGEPRSECQDVPVERHVDNGNRAAGTVLGAIVGGVLGSTVGKGDGRTAATVAGAVAGGAVGNNVGGRNSDAYYEDRERRCRTVHTAAESRVVAYDVQYRYRGDVYMSRLAFDPGDRLRVRVSVSPTE